MVLVDYHDIRSRGVGVNVEIPPVMRVRVSNMLGLTLFEHELPLNLKIDQTHSNLVAFNTI